MLIISMNPINSIIGAVFYILFKTDDFILSIRTTTDIYAELMKQASEEALEFIAEVLIRKVK